MRAVNLKTGIFLHKKAQSEHIELYIESSHSTSDIICTGVSNS